MKILLLNQVFYPDVVATSNYLSDLALALTERGHQVTVVTGRRAYDDPRKLFPAREKWRGVRILRVFSTRFGKHAKWRRAADFASFIFSCCARLAFLPRHEVVVTLTTPPLISFIGAWRARFCYWVMDLNPDEAVAAGWLRAGSFAGWALERMSRFSLRRADQIIALDPFMRDRIIAQGIAREKIAVIPPWAHDDQVRFDAAGREKFRQAHEMRDKFVVMYAGNHSPVHPLDTLMQAADALKNDGSMLFCFMGGGSEFKRVQRWAAEGKRANVLCLPYRPLNELSSALSAADAHVVVMGSAMPGLVHPCKIYNILAVNAPVIYIGPRPSHVTEILEGPGMNHPWASVQHGEAQALARQIQELRRNINGSSRLPANERVAAYSKKVLLPNLMLVLEECPTRPIN